ncbi:SAM-dependent methyltransferase, partial [Thermus scotoductus]|uniref:SAM-dependent methyltransferase n=1 Tax=Thermus scotoductus TaxID=37636 RepID=UPI0020A2AE35
VGLPGRFAGEEGEVFLAVIPGVTAANAVASLLGSPLAHDTCLISLSDLLTPWPLIERRLHAAGQGDFVVVLYNPQSKRRDWQLRKSAEILLEYRPKETPAALVKSAYRKRQEVALTTKGMTLEEIVLALAEEARKGRGVVRLHSGDPGLYGTLLEEKEALEALGVGVEVVPGVTAAFALAARAGLSLTAPEVAQAVAFTRLGVRTPVPEGQDPKSLARKGLTLAVYLSGMHPRRLSRELLEAGLPGDTPVLYGHKVAQPGEEVGLTDLKGLAHLPARDTTVYLVGEALRAKGVRSLLYDPSFKHRYRR